MAFVIDEETGENLCQAYSDAETGEPEDDILPRKTLFQIPKKVKDDLKSRKKRVSLMKPVSVGTSFGQTNPVFLFLPAIIYLRWFLVLLMAFEVNKNNKVGGSK